MLSSAVKMQCQIGTEPHFSPAGVLAPQTNTGKCPFYWNCKNSSVCGCAQVRMFVWFCVAPVHQLNPCQCVVLFLVQSCERVQGFLFKCDLSLSWSFLCSGTWHGRLGSDKTRAQEPDKPLFESSVITMKNHFAFLLLLFHVEALGSCGSWLFYSLRCAALLSLVWGVVQRSCIFDAVVMGPKS